MVTMEEDHDTEYHAKQIQGRKRSGGAYVNIALGVGLLLSTVLCFLLFFLWEEPMWLFVAMISLHGGYWRLTLGLKGKSVTQTL